MNHLYTVQRCQYLIINCPKICGSGASAQIETICYIISFKQHHLVCFIKASFHLFSRLGKDSEQQNRKNNFFCSECHFKAVFRPFPKQRKSYVKDSELCSKKVRNPVGYFMIISLTRSELESAEALASSQHKIQTLSLIHI